MNYEARVTAMTICKKDEPLFSKTATVVQIVDEIAGEFVEVSQSSREGRGKIAIEACEWPTLRTVIDDMIANCRDNV